MRNPWYPPVMTQIFVGEDTERLWAKVEADRAAQIVAENVASQAQSAAFAANQALMDAANAFTVSFDQWARHCAARTKAK